MIADEPEVVDREESRAPAIISIDATDDSAYRHPCGAMVTPRFDGSGVTPKCPVCRQAT
jgi:hypothetical protein